MQEDQIGVTYFMYKFTLQFHSTCASVHVACDDIIRDTVIPFHSLYPPPPPQVWLPLYPHSMEHLSFLSKRVMLTLPLDMYPQGWLFFYGCKPLSSLRCIVFCCIQCAVHVHVCHRFYSVHAVFTLSKLHLTCVLMNMLEHLGHYI